MKKEVQPPKTLQYLATICIFLVFVFLGPFFWLLVLWVSFFFGFSPFIVNPHKRWMGDKETTLFLLLYLCPRGGFCE